MKQEKKSLMKRLLDRVFPRMPDFYGLMNEQHDMAVETMQVFSDYLQSGDAALAQEVRDLEHRADQLKYRNIEVLNSSFSTPMDREDLYDAISGIDYLINFAKTTVYELHVGEGDLGKVIGKHGQTAKSIRTLIAAISAKKGKRAVLEILE